MTISEKLQTLLETTLHVKPCYGASIYSIIEGVSFEATHEKVTGASHSIAEIVMRTLASLGGCVHARNGKWQRLVASFKLANVALAQLIANFPVIKWNKPTNDDRGTYVDYSLIYEAMIVGLL